MTRPPFTDEEPPVEALSYDALLADRDGWKRVAHEQWRNLEHVRRILKEHEDRGLAIDLCQSLRGVIG